MNTHPTAVQEAQNLAKRFAELKQNGVSQAKFARDHDVPGGANFLNQHIKGRRQIGMDSALVYARGLGCTLEDISPRLAAQVTGVKVDNAPAVEPQKSSNFAAALAALFDTIAPDDELRATIFSDLTAAISEAKRSASRQKTQERQEVRQSETQHG
jgi:hypothetical protein